MSSAEMPDDTYSGLTQKQAERLKKERGYNAAVTSLKRDDSGRAYWQEDKQSAVVGSTVDTTSVTGRQKDNKKYYLDEDNEKSSEFWATSEELGYGTKAERGNDPVVTEQWSKEDVIKWSEEEDKKEQEAYDAEQKAKKDKKEQEEKDKEAKEAKEADDEKERKRARRVAGGGSYYYSGPSGFTSEKTLGSSSLLGS